MKGRCDESTVNIRCSFVEKAVYESGRINEFDIKSRCPIDREIMPGFEYSEGATKATSTFLAHKFPYTKSVYYQCHVRLCHKPSGGCDDVVSRSLVSSRVSSSFEP